MDMDEARMSFSTSLLRFSSSCNSTLMYIAAHQLRFRGKIARDTVLMDLLGQVVKDADVMSGFQQSVCKGRSYKACSAGNENIFCHAYSAPIKTASLFFAAAYLRTDHAANSTKSSARLGGLV